MYSSYIHGSKGSAIVSKPATAGRPRAPTGARTGPREHDLGIQDPPGEGNPYDNEWNDLVDAIRNDKPYNEAESGVMASLVSSLGRRAAHTGREITLEDILNSDHEYAPDVDKMTMDSPAPLKADADGKYPIPQPGLIGTREF